MKKVVAYCVAGGILLLIADEAPKVAMGTTGLILLGVALTHSDQIKAVSTFITKNTGS
jgi:hypothetical protein